VLSFWMLQSARVRPSSSCSPADWNIHLDGYGLVVLEWDNLVVEGGPNPGPRQGRQTMSGRRLRFVRSRIHYIYVGQLGQWTSCQHMGMPIVYVSCWAGTTGWERSQAQPNVVLVPAQAQNDRAGFVLVSGQKFVLWAGPWASCFLVIYRLE
jgi:hypothetical protein